MGWCVLAGVRVPGTAPHCLNLAPFTDNIFTLKSYCVEKFSMVSSEFDKALGLPADLDYMT